MLMYETLTGAPYWAVHPNPDDVLAALRGAPGAPPLPHEAAPVATSVFQRILGRMLTREPAARVSAQQLEELLRTEVSKDVPNTTLNPPTDTLEKDTTYEMTAP